MIPIEHLPFPALASYPANIVASFLASPELANPFSLHGKGEHALEEQS